MFAREPMTHFSTHDVVNQPCPLKNYNVYNQDQALVEGLHREGAASFDQSAQTLGESAGSEDVIRLGFLANDYPPELKSYDRYGQRIDEIEFHPAYHELMRLGFGAGIQSIAWNNHGPGGHVAHTALIYLMAQVDAGVCCPIAMSYAAVPSLKRQPDVAAEWLPKILSQQYDPRCIPADEKTGCTIGMAMTEKQGGSDVRANTTKATPIASGGPGKAYHLTGHKWFYSAPMSDVFLTLAKTNAGLSCFLVPRWLPEGHRNCFYIQRIKHKLGNQSNASAEMEYHNTWAQLIGSESEGVRTIIDMVHHTRLDASASGAGLMRAALVQAIHHAVHRSAFGKRLIKQPGMKNVLADLALESEAATTLFLRVARTFDDSGANESERLLCRFGTALAKYWINKRAPAFVAEALECHGGAGYIEESIMPRLYREAPLNGIWEGSGTVVCLDILRTLYKERDAIDAYITEIEQARGCDKRLDRYIESVKQLLLSFSFSECDARRITEQLALCLQAALLVRHAPTNTADAFCASRLGANWGYTFGTLPRGLPFSRLIERAWAIAD